MKLLKLKKKLIVVLSVVLTLTVATAVYAVDRIYNNKNLSQLKEYIDENNVAIQVIDSERDVLDKQYLEYIRQVNESKKQTALLQNQADRISFDRAQLTLKRQQQKNIESYELQVSYYNVCLSMKNLEIAQKELELYNKQIEVEEQLLSIGQSTQLNVDNLYNQKEQVQNNIASLTQAIEQEKNAVRIKLDENPNVSFSPLFIIPDSVTGGNIYNLNTLRQNSVSRNLNYNKYNVYIAYHGTLITGIKDSVGETNASYSIAVSERNKMITDQKQLKQQIEQFTEKQFNSYKDTLNQYTTIYNRKNIWQDQLNIIEAQYSNGDISELQYLSYKFNIIKEQFSLYQAIVNKHNAQVLMELINNGVVN